MPTPPPPTINPAFPPHCSLGTPLQNLGNTCYINAVLQSLTHSLDVCSSVSSSPHRSRCALKDDSNAFCILCEFESLLGRSLSCWNKKQDLLALQRTDPSAPPVPPELNIIEPTNIVNNLEHLSTNLQKGRQEVRASRENKN